MLRAFQYYDVLAHADAALESFRYRTHEFGDSVLIFSQRRASAPLTPSAERADRRADAVLC